MSMSINFPPSTRYYPDVDMLYIEMSANRTSEKIREIEDGIRFDINSEGKPVGIEVDFPAHRGLDMPSNTTPYYEVCLEWTTTKSSLELAQELYDQADNMSPEQMLEKIQEILLASQTVKA